MKKTLKSIYKSIPFKKYVFLFIRKIGNPSMSVYQHLSFNDDFIVKVDSNRSFKIRHYGFKVENEIFWKGIFNGWEKISLSIWAELCEKSDVIFDIGANTGVYALLAKSKNEAAKVYAFEPVQRVFEKLKKNNDLNDFGINCSEKAISNYDGEATIFDKDTAHTYSVTVNEDHSKNKETSIPISIETVRLDSFVDSEQLPKIDLLKIDVEMHEVEALEGFGKYLKQFEPSMIIEILSDEVATGIEKLISGINYEFYIINEKTGVRKVKHLRNEDYYNFLICKPEVAKRLDTLSLFDNKKIPV